MNPYLLLAAILGGAMNGIEDGRDPPAPVTGNAYEADLPGLAPGWAEAIDRFETSQEVARIFPELLISNLVLTKRQELAAIAGLDPKSLTRLYLESV